MSGTRKAPEGSELRQNRYCSSTAIDRGLLANLVCKRLATVPDRSARELILSVQYMSHQPGGLAGLVKELLAKYPERIATEAMVKTGRKAGQEYTADEVRAVRGDFAGTYLLKGELSFMEEAALPEPEHSWDSVPGSKFLKERARKLRQLKAEAEKWPERYPVDLFASKCREAVETHLEELLAKICLDPALDLGAVRPWYFPRLVETLDDYFAARAASIMNGMVLTSIGEMVRESIDYGWQTGSMVLIEGEMRTGKSFAATRLCDMLPGRYRYVQVPPTADDIGFFKAIADALGLSKRTTLKAVELRERVSAVLRESGLMLIFDEAHYLMPIHTRISSLPTRANWIICELINQQLPCALILTDQFEARLKHVVDQTGWKAGQLLYRAGQRFRLPGKLTVKELGAIAKVHLPEADQPMITRLATYGAVSPGSCAVVAFRARRARYLAEQDGRAIASYRDVEKAISEDALPPMETLKKGRRRVRVESSDRNRDESAVDGRFPLDEVFSE